MPVQKGTSSLKSKFADRLLTAAAKTQNAEVDWGIQDLPPGVQGIAQLRDCRIMDIKAGGPNAGKPMFFASAVVVEPKEHEGKRTSISEMLFDTPQSKTRPSFEDHVAYVQNELRKLGAPNDSLGGEDIEDTCSALADAKPFFAFATSSGKKSKEYPNPKTFHNWYGIKNLEDYAPVVDTQAGMVDNTAHTNGRASTAPTTPATPAPKPAPTPPKPSPSPSTPAPSPSPPTPATPRAPSTPGAIPSSQRKPTGMVGGKKQMAVVEQDEDKPAFDDAGDIDSLLKRAQSNESDAQGELRQLAINAGNDEETVDATATWEEVYNMIVNAGAATNASETEEEEALPFSVEDVCMYSPVDPKTKKTGKAVECIVTAVYPKGKTADLRNLANRKVVYTKVPWDSLSVPETE